ncbi:MAG: DUF433 domain-containing protein [Desulfoferrobacter sp.]
MEQRDLIEIRPDVMLGKPVIKGTRIPVIFQMSVLEKIVFVGK